MAIAELWVEKFRPNTVDGYVFVDDAQREQVQAWIKQGSIPHLLLSGSPGTGKCLGGNEPITVQIDLTTLSNDQLSQLEKYRI